MDSIVIRLSSVKCYSFIVAPGTTYDKEVSNMPNYKHLTLKRCMMIFVELTSSIRFAVVTSSLNGERVELSLANYKLGNYIATILKIM